MKHIYLTILFSLAAACAQAGTILDTLPADADSRLTMGSFTPPSQVEPLGQTFNLLVPTMNLKAGGVVSDVNELFSPTFTVTIGIYGGGSFDSAPLATQVFDLPDGLTFEFIEADFSGLGTFAPGLYALGFSSLGPRGALHRAVVGSPASQAIDANGPYVTGGDPNVDFAVRITGDPVLPKVPLPAAAPLLASGLLAFAWIARRRRAQV